MAFLDQLNPQLSLADLLNGGEQAPPFRPPGFNPMGQAGTSAGGIVPPVQSQGDPRLGQLMPPTPAPGAPPFRPPSFNPGGAGGVSTAPTPAVGMSTANKTGGVLGVPPAPSPMPPTPMPPTSAGGSSAGGAGALPPFGTSVGKGAPPMGGPPVFGGAGKQMPPIGGPPMVKPPTPMPAKKAGNY